jgi:competence protein ComEA
MVLALGVICTGCGSSRVSFVQTDTSTNTDEASGDEDNEIYDTVTDASDTDLGENANEEDALATEDEEPESLAVYVCGAVNAPGVYYFEAGDIKAVALETAGGFAEGAATDYVNLAEKLCDGEKLYFPYEEEVEAGDIKYTDSDGDTMSADDTAALETTDTSSGKVNINTADKTQLMTLPGIGESKAELIISYRESNGSFSTIEDIMNINGIKSGVYSKIKDYITVD